MLLTSKLKMEILKGYHPEIENIRESEFPQLKDVTYVEHVGATLFAKSQIEAYNKELLGNLYGNPHSRSPSSSLSTDATDHIRYRVLRHFNVDQDEYSVIFTPNCTGALKLVAEHFTTNTSEESYGNDVSISQHLNIIKGDSDNGLGPSRKSKDPSTLSHTRFEFNTIDTTCNENVSPPRPDYGGTKRPLGCFCYLLDNHTSVQGMRGAMKNRLGAILCVDKDDIFSKDDVDSSVIYRQSDYEGGGNSLFAFPAQSNFSGRKYPLEWIQQLRNSEFAFQYRFPGRWFSVLDAAAYVSTSVLDLSVYKPDFVTLSFYKMMGFPTSIGCLLVRKDVEHLLQKNYFGGGTVMASSATDMFTKFRTSVSDRFEDGTIPFLEILAIRHGFEALEKLGGGMRSISDHTFAIANYFFRCLRSLRHGNGQELAVIYCDTGFEDKNIQGAIINFNLKRANGEFIGFAEVDKLAQLYKVHLRTGCFCNIGACQKYLRLTSKQIKYHLQSGHVCGDDKDLIDGQPTGSVRISFGYMSTIRDAQNCLMFIANCFLEDVRVSPHFMVNQTGPLHLDKSDKSLCDTESDAVLQNNDVDKIDVPKFARGETSHLYDVPTEKLSKKETTEIQILEKDVHKTVTLTSPAHVDNTVIQCDANAEHNIRKEETGTKAGCQGDTRRLSAICLYPVKSCGAFRVSSWTVCETGLLYDRRWMVVSPQGVAISQKREPLMCMIKPALDLQSRTLTLTFYDMEPLCLPIDVEEDERSQNVLGCSSKVCGDRVAVIDCGETASAWLSQALKRPGCRLIQQDSSRPRSSKLKDSNTISTESQETSSEHISLVNESQYLMISTQSVVLLQQKLQEGGNLQDNIESIDIANLISRFRANLIIEGGQPLEEDDWIEILIGSHHFTSQGGCTRCQMICLDQTSGIRSKEPLRTLVRWRGGKVPFGIHLRNSFISRETELCVGDSVQVIQTGFDTKPV